MQPSNWTDHWMKIAHTVAERSKDGSFKAGAVVVSCDGKTLLATGFNGPPPAMDDTMIDQTQRPLVRALTCHAESNALWFAACNSSNHLEDGTLFINGVPCHRCVLEMVRAGLHHCYYDDTNPKQPKMVDEAEWLLSQSVAKRGGLLLTPYSTVKGTNDG